MEAAHKVGLNFIEVTFRLGVLIPKANRNRLSETVELKAAAGDSVGDGGVVDHLRMKRKNLCSAA